MPLFKSSARRMLLVAVFAAASSLGGWPDAANAATQFVGPTSSQPMALTADDGLLAVANPDNNSVTIFNVRGDSNLKITEVQVQSEPNGVAFLPDGSKLYVANTVSGTVTVLINPGGSGWGAVGHIAVGTEPYGLALTPNGKKLYVSNARSNTISVIDTASDTVTKTIAVNAEPRGLAITNDGDADDDDETVYVTHFLSFPQAGKIDGQDDAKTGRVSVLSTTTDTVISVIAVNPIGDTGFKALGDALARIAPPANPVPADFKFTTGAYPNQLNSVGIKGNFAYVPNTGASPNGPVRFDVNTHSLLSVLNRSTNVDAGQTLNMHTAVRDQTATPKLFITQPWAIAFKNAANEGYVISAASNHVVKLVVNPTTGSAVVQSDPTNTARVLQVKVGKNPRGIVVNSTDTRAYVMNYISRSVTVISLTSAPETVLATLASAALPTPGTLADSIHIGKELYNTSIGEFDPAPGTSAPITGRMSNNGWGSCAACHSPFATTDNVVWIFPAGPRKSISQHTDFDQSDPTRSRMRALLWSAGRDEQEDFENNIRAVSGGLGMIVLADGITQDTNTPDLLPTPPATPIANGGRNQLKVRGIGGWDAIKAFVQFGIRSPISPVAKTEPDVVAGRALFQSANCQSCHGGPQWTNSTINFQAPPTAVQVVAGQLVDQLRNVGTFDPAVLNEIRQNAQPPLGAAGFVPPSLLSLHAFPETFFHNGSASSLDQVLANVTHRSAGTGGVDTLTNAADRAKLARFLLSIDAATVPIAPSTANVIEYFHAGFDHYFITHHDGEIAALDAGNLIKGWTRTGKFFLVNLTPRTGTSPVCRFYIPPALGDSHFFGRGPAECNATAQKNPSFLLEDTAFMHLVIPTAGVCPAGTTPIYRVFSNRPDANHRYMNDRAVRTQMTSMGWLAEGDGPDLVVMCGP
jgi:YVTN family beta-propeller protein